MTEAVLDWRPTEVPMKLKAPLAAAGATLASGVCYADEPVTIEAVKGGYQVELAASGSVLSATADQVTLGIWNEKEKGLGLRIAVTADGLVVVGPDDDAEVRIRGSGATVELTSDTHGDCGPATPVLSCDGAAKDAAFRDCASGAEVRVSPSAFTVDVDGVNLFRAEGTFFGCSVDAVALDGVRRFALDDLDLAAVSVSGETSGGGFSNLDADEARFSGTHHGVVIAGGSLDRLEAEGELTGAAVKGATIRVYDGPDTFREPPTDVKR